MKKKLLIIAGCVVAVILIALILIPIFFKDKVIALIKSQANKQLNARLEFEDVSLGLFRDFPNLTFALNRLTIINNPPFAGDTLVTFSEFKTSVDLLTLIRDRSVKIVSLKLDEPAIHLKALKDGRVNWDITKPAAREAEADTAEGFKIALKKYAIRDAYLVYEDEASGMKVNIEKLDHSGSGDFSKDQFQLRTNTTIAALTFNSGGINYLNGVQTRLKADVDVDAANSKYTLLENELQLNDLILRFDGSAAVRGEETQLNFTFSAPQTEFKSLLSLIPAIYQKDFAELKSSGQLALQGKVNGVYAENRYPAFNLALQVNNGAFQYPDLPSAVNNVNLNLAVDSPGGDLDNTVVNLKNLHLELGREPFDATALVRTPVSDPNLAATVRGKINLGELRNAMPLAEGTELAGVVSSDLRLNGKMSSLESGRYQDFKADGNIVFNGISYQALDLPERVNVSQARLSFTPQNVQLSDFSCMIGKSDLRAHGALDNVLPYVMSDATLKGTLVVESRFFDLNPWMQGESEELTAVELPDKIEFALNSAFQEVLFGKLRMQNIRGTMMLKDRTLHLMDLNMNMLNGSLVANGSYSTPVNQPPRSFFDLKITNFSIAQTFQSFVTVQRFVPIAQHMQGEYGASLQLMSDLDSTLTPLFETLSSKGSLRMGKIVVQDFKPLTKLAEAVKMEKYKKLVMQSINPSYKISDGRFHLEPVTFQAENTTFVVAGSNGLDRSLDYSVRIQAPAKELNQQAGSLVNQLSNGRIDLTKTETVEIAASIGGSVTDPQIKLATAEMVKGAAAQVAQLAKKELEERKAVVADTVGAAIAKQKLEAEKLKQAAADSIKRETKRLEEEAKKKLKKLFKP